MSTDKQGILGIFPDKMQTAIIKKDIKSITANRRILITLTVLPLVMTILVPLSFLLPILLSPDESQNMTELVELVSGPGSGNMQQTLISLMLNNILPLFFILIPIMSSSVMAAGSFIGEKEKKTLETLFYCPLPLKSIFNAKITASLILGMTVSVFSFIVMFLINGTLIFIFSKTIFIPGINWITIMFLISPAASLVSISLIVRASAKAKSSEEASSTSLFLVMPIILLFVGQFSGVMMMSGRMFLLLGAVLAVIALVMFKKLFGKFSYQTLLQ